MSIETIPIFPRIFACLGLTQRAQRLNPTGFGEHPLAHRLFQGLGDVQQSPLAAVPDSKIQGTMQLALPAAAGGLAARPGPAT
jgi:hypothetical protein